MIHFKKGLFFLLIICSCTSFAFAQTILIPSRDKNLWGFADTNGIIKIKPAYDSVGFFYHYSTTAEVYLDKKVSLINSEGKLILPFSDSYELSRSNYILKLNKKKGIYSQTGIQILPIKFDKFEWASNYDEYRTERNKMVAFKNGEYFLFDLVTQNIEKIQKPKEIDHSGVWSIVAPLNDGNTITVPFPFYNIKEFPRITKSYKNLVHCETLYGDGNRVFVIFCIRQNGTRDYVGENGIEFFRN